MYPRRRGRRGGVGEERDSDRPAAPLSGNLWPDFGGGASVAFVLTLEVHRRQSAVEDGEKESTSEKRSETTGTHGSATADSRASGNSKLTCRSTHGRELDVTTREPECEIGGFTERPKKSRTRGHRTRRGHSGEMIGDVYEEASRGLYTGAIGVALPMTRQSSIVGQRGSRVNPSFFNHQGAETP